MLSPRTLIINAFRSATRVPTLSVAKVNPYALFLKEEAANKSITNKNELAKFGKATGEKWNALSAQDKRVWGEKATSLRAKAISDFKKLPEDEQMKLEAKAREEKEERAKRRERKERRDYWEETGHPKRPATAFLLFCSERKSNVKLTSLQEAKNFIKKAGEDWKAMTETEKSKYTTPASAAFKKYNEDVAKWKAVNTENKL